ncbi:hypothetical protein [Sneathiella sp.]
MPRKLYLRAANDNYAPMAHWLKKLSKILLPLVIVSFFAAVWYFGGS